MLLLFVHLHVPFASSARNWCLVSIYIYIFPSSSFSLGVVLVQGQSMSEGQRPKASPVRSRTCIFSWHWWHLANLTSNKPPPTDGILSHRHSNSKSHHLSFLPQTLATQLSFASLLRIIIVDFFSPAIFHRKLRSPAWPLTKRRTAMAALDIRKAQKTMAKVCEIKRERDSKEKVSF